MKNSTPNRPITSRENKSVKYLISLSDPRNRKKEKAFLVEGMKITEEALGGNADVMQVAAAPSLLRHHGKGIIRIAESRGIEIVWMSERLIDVISESKTPQPVMAVVRMTEHDESVLAAYKPGLCVIAHGLQDPGNLGTIIRTAEAAGAAGVGMTQGTADPYGSRAVRASMGSILRLPVIRINDLHRFIGTCRKNGFQTIATTLESDKTHYDIDYRKPTAVIVGQEGSGLPEDALALVDRRIRIPMAGAIDSLNVATAAAVILYEAMRQRM